MNKITAAKDILDAYTKRNLNGDFDLNVKRYWWIFFNYEPPKVRCVTYCGPEEWINEHEAKRILLEEANFILYQNTK